MWKVLVAICLMGQPCTLFVEDPMKYYHSEAECMVAAEAKSKAMMKTFEDIKFKQHQSGKGIHGKLTIENGMSLSVVAGEYFYSEPRSDVAPNGYSRFEIAIFDYGIYFFF